MKDKEHLAAIGTMVLISVISLILIVKLILNIF